MEANEHNKDGEGPEELKQEGHYSFFPGFKRKNRRIGIQVPLYDPSEAPAPKRISADEYRAAIEHQKEYQEKNSSKRNIRPIHVAIGVMVIIFDLLITQFLPIIIKFIGVTNQVQLGEWLLGLTGVVTVGALIYIFTSK